MAWVRGGAEKDWRCAPLFGAMSRDSGERDCGAGLTRCVPGYLGTYLVWVGEGEGVVA